MFHSYRIAAFFMWSAGDCLFGVSSGYAAHIAVVVSNCVMYVRTANQDAAVNVGGLLWAALRSNASYAVIVRAHCCPRLFFANESYGRRPITTASGGNAQPP